MKRYHLLFSVLATIPLLALLQTPAIGAPSPIACQPTSYPAFNKLTQPTTEKFVDGRPAFSPDGETVLFMRGPAPTGEPSSLYTINLFGGQTKEIEPIGCPQVKSFTRPDWSWHRNSFAVAFSGESSIYLLDMTTSRCRLVLKGSSDDNKIYSYPSWYPDGQSLSITNYWIGVNQNGCSSKPNPKQALLRTNVRHRAKGPLTSPQRIWPGMSSVAQDPLTGSPLIAFAGESPKMNLPYCQNDNQIWIRLPHGQLRQVDGGQGRAPWWSPSAKLIAFESNRCTGKNYQIFVQDPFQPEKIIAVTPPESNVQHAKWSPDGRKLVFAYQAEDDGWGIAYIDLGSSDPFGF